MKRGSTRQDQAIGYALRSLFEAFSACKKVDWRKTDRVALTNAAALLELIMKELRVRTVAPGTQQGTGAK